MSLDSSLLRRKSKYRSISVRIVAISLAGALGIVAIAGSAFILGSRTKEALETQAAAGEIAKRTNEIERQFGRARQSLTEFLRTQQTSSVETLNEATKAIAAQATAIIALPEADAVRAPVEKLGELAKRVESAMAELVERARKVGADQDAGLLGASVKAGETLERSAIANAQQFNTAAAWRIAQAASAIRRQEQAYLTRREEHRLGDMEVDVSRFERYVNGFDADADAQKKLTAELAAYRTAFETWREADTALIRTAEKLSDELVVALPLLDEIGTTIGQQVAAASAALAQAQALQIRLILFIGGGVLIASLLIALAVGRSMTGPLQRLRRAMQRLAEGHTDETIPETTRADEIGDMARTVEVFRDNALERARLTEEQEQEQNTRLRRAAAVDQLIATFRDAMSESIRSVTRAVEDLATVSASLNETAVLAIGQTTNASASVEESAANVNLVSSAATQLTSSIAEIAARATESNQVAQRAFTTAQETLDAMRALETSAFEIGEVVDLIRSIADQTNLLALNATIEAARAGEAGRGFSVVASEVKALATQTARATDDIARQVAAIQASSGEASRALVTVNGIIETMSSLAAAVAGAVEEQSAAVESIASSVAAAALKAQAGTRAMDDVAEATRQAETAASEVEALSKRLEEEAATVGDRVTSFIENVRAA